MDWSVIATHWQVLAEGLAHSLVLCLFAATAAIALGAVVAWAQLRPGGALRWLADVYTALCLGLPLLVVIFVLFYALPTYGLTLAPDTVGVLALMLYYAPYFAQVMAGALRSIAPGHREAAAALGLPALRTLRRILLPQALPIMLPTMTGLLIGLFKDSALLAVVSVPEFMFAARQVIAETYAPLEVYATVALAYWLLSLVCAAVGSRLEQHLGAYQRRAAAPSMPSTSQPAP